MMNEDNIVEARRARRRVNVAELDHEEWARARPVRLARYWSGEAAPPARQAEARLLWDEEALSARFVCEQREPIVASASPERGWKTMGLWDRDVCEMFVAPSVSDPSCYFEFEVAPTGEWLDLAVRMTTEGRETDWGFYSGMTAAARIHADSIIVAMRVPWDAFGMVAAPRAGERWRVNLFRCVGEGETRGYIAWLPTLAPEPNFHVPEKFGWLHFAD
ncbi:MAG TPA: carbohydrate-binding family 9-like protein [Pyrinomonadaceae bacterium]|nr:carbohydrate-binding family 9-like protein [Pyrinomonadaceae bacterium]